MYIDIHVYMYYITDHIISWYVLLNNAELFIHHIKDFCEHILWWMFLSTLFSWDYVANISTMFMAFWMMCILVLCNM